MLDVTIHNENGACQVQMYDTTFNMKVRDLYANARPAEGSHIIIATTFKDGSAIIHENPYILSDAQYDKLIDSTNYVDSNEFYAVHGAYTKVVDGRTVEIQFGNLWVDGVCVATVGYDNFGQCVATWRKTRKITSEQYTVCVTAPCHEKLIDAVMCEMN